MARDSMFGEKVFILAQMVHQPLNPHPQRHRQTAKLDEEGKTVVHEKEPEAAEEEGRRHIACWMQSLPTIDQKT